MKLYKIALLIMMTTLLIVIGCSDRGVNYDKDNTGAISEGAIVRIQGSHVYHHELLFQTNNVLQQLNLAGYTPKVSFPGEEFRKVPLLILLPPQDGNEDFFFRHGLKELADELISNGTIEPMAIVCVSNNQLFGGYFFANNSPSAGFYDDLIGAELVLDVRDRFFAGFLKTTQGNTAIGGFGMGAYGAFRAAMLHDTTFGSVSGVAGPMDFDGTDNNSGFIPLFSEALAEQGITGQNLKLNYNTQNDWPLTRLFIGGGFAFSPQDTMYTYDAIGTDDLYRGYNLVSVYSLDTIDFPLASAINIAPFDELPNTFENDPYQNQTNVGFYLPFDSAGNVDAPVWSLWMNNNLPNIFTSHPNAFSAKNVWIGNSSETTFGNYYDQTNSWTSTLKTAGVSVTEFNITGYDGHPANKDQYVYDYLREMLIFHSDNFEN